jgi:hypothetical protein
MLIEDVEKGGLGGISAELKTEIMQRLADIRIADQEILKMVDSRIAELRPI